MCSQKEPKTMRADLLTLPRERDIPPGELLRRKEHLISEARDAHRTNTRRRFRLITVAVALALSVLVSSVALGVVQDIASYFAGWRDEPDYPAPVPTAPDVVIASGVAGAPWTIVATTSDQGLCLGLFVEDGGGAAACGPSDVRGDPGAIDARHWIGAFGVGGGDARLNQTFAFGRLAEDVASVELLLTDGQSIQAQVVTRPEGLDAPLNFYWAAWPCGSSRCLDAVGPLVKMAVARDSAGRVLERRIPSWNGNPTGDPKGPPLPE
jgi:hypothetical protein